jgi:hypothetical protein
MVLPEDAGKIDLDLGEMRFTEGSDGSVAIEVPDTVTVSVAIEDAEAVKTQMSMNQSGQSLIATGDPEDVTYTYKADTLGFVMDNLTVDGATVGSDILSIKVNAAQVGSVMKVTAGDLQSFDQTLTMGQVDFDVNFADPESDDTFKMRGQNSDVTFAGTGVVPMDAGTFNDMTGLLRSGFEMDGGYKIGASSAEMVINGADGSGTINFTGTGGTFDVDMSAKGLGYMITQTGITMNALMTEFPLPISFDADRIAFDLRLPTLKGADAQDLGLLVSLENMVMADSIWGLFDAAGQLPRDPATITMDLSGKAKLLFDYLDPAQAAVIETTGAMPGELEALSLNKLTVDVAGAKLTGAGSFVFDNSDMFTFGGMPRPEGSLNMQLIGGNTLLGKLESMGLVSQEDVMGARMMMGLFARPGEGEDSLETQLDINAEGHVLANGQRVR